MRRGLLTLSLLCVTALAACQDAPPPVAQFWRPVSEPNVLMSTDQVQRKLDFDISQCHCGIYPTNATHNDIVQFQPDQQRLAETGVVVVPDDNGTCMRKPSLVVTECMRQRGWEPTNCSGRIPTANGGSLCAAYTQPSDE